MPPRRRAPNPTDAQSSHATSQNSPDQSPPRPERKIAEFFLRQNPPTFSGTGDPAEAEEWVRAMERIFKFLECSDKECMLCLSFQLKGPADFWWESRQRTLTPEQKESFTWEQFKKELYAKYIPRSYKKQKEMEFANLKQGKRSVAEYDREFCMLARYAPYKVDTDEKMAEMFKAGLNKEMRIILASQPPMSYAETLNRALDMELEMNVDKAVSEANPSSAQTQTRQFSGSDKKFKGKRKWEGKNVSNKRQWQQLTQSSQNQPRLST